MRERERDSSELVDIMSNLMPTKSELKFTSCRGGIKNDAKLGFETGFISSLGIIRHIRNSARRSW